MRNAISNTSPLLYLYRIGVLDWLSDIFDEICTPQSVVLELHEGQRRGYDVPVPEDYSWLKIANPKNIPPQWFALDLGPGELAAMALALEYQNHILLLDDGLARRTAQAAGLTVWGTLKILLEAKQQGLTDQVAPLIDRLANAGMWISDKIRERILTLAHEALP